MESYDWSRRKADILISTSPDKTAGTVTVVNGSATVTGSSTAWATTDVDRTLTIGSNTYSLWNVKTAPTATSLTLGDRNGTAVVYPGDSDSGLAYVMFTQFYEVGAGIEQIVSVKYQGELREVSETFLDNLDPNRSATGIPVYYARGSRKMSGTNDIVRIELYPRPDDAVVVNVKVQLGHVALSSTMNPIVPSGPLQWFAAMDTAFFLKAKTKDDTWITLAHEFGGEGKASLEFERGQDMAKFGVQQQVRDVNGGVDASFTDLGLDHDFGL